jgi:hypothetical protein
MSEQVECHSDVEYAERPIAIQWQGQRLQIVDILTRWRSPNGKCFRVKTTDDQIFDLFYDELYDEWRILQP